MIRWRKWYVLSDGQQYTVSTKVSSGKKNQHTPGGDVYYLMGLEGVYSTLLDLAIKDRVREGELTTLRELHAETVAIASELREAVMCSGRLAV